MVIIIVSNINISGYSSGTQQDCLFLDEIKQGHMICFRHSNQKWHEHMCVCVFSVLRFEESVFFSVLFFFFSLQPFNQTFRILVALLGIEAGPHKCKYKVLTTGWPGSPQVFFSILIGNKMTSQGQYFLLSLPHVVTEGFSRGKTPHASSKFLNLSSLVPCLTIPQWT